MLLGTFYFILFCKNVVNMGETCQDEKKKIYDVFVHTQMVNMYTVP